MIGVEFCACMKYEGLMIIQYSDTLIIHMISGLAEGVNSLKPLKKLLDTMS